MIKQINGHGQEQFFLLRINRLVMQQFSHFPNKKPPPKIEGGTQTQHMPKTKSSEEASLIGFFPVQKIVDGIYFRTIVIV